MIERLERLIEALRDELQQYGEMLARLDRQQELVMRRAADELLQATADIEAQSRVIQESRRERGARQRELADQAGPRLVGPGGDLPGRAELVAREGAEREPDRHAGPLADQPIEAAPDAELGAWVVLHVAGRVGERRVGPLVPVGPGEPQVPTTERLHPRQSRSRIEAGPGRRHRE